MIKQVILASFASLTIACAPEVKTPEQLAEPNKAWWAKHEVCYDHVVYIQWHRNLTVKLKPSGKPHTVTALGVQCK
jgi:hypothetical protein